MKLGVQDGMSVGGQRKKMPVCGTLGRKRPHTGGRPGFKFSLRNQRQHDGLV